MKHIALEIKDKKNYTKAKIEASEKKYTSGLVQIFSSITKKKKLQKIVDKINKDFPNATVIGTTTAGEIANATMYEKSTTLSISLFEKTKLSAYYTPTTDKKSGIKLAKKISKKESKAVVILSEGLLGEDYEGFIKGIKKHNPKLLVSGGLAGDNFMLKKTYIIYKNQVLERGSVGVSFSGKELFASNDYNLNWAPIGKSFTITSATNNIVHTIDGVDAVEHFKHYLGKEIFADNSSALSEFQLLYKEGSTTVSRTPMAIDKDKKSLIFAAPLQEGKIVQFGFSDASNVLDGANAIGEKISQDAVEGVYVYSCIARKTLLGKKLENEFKAFDRFAPTAGFFTYGEFYSTDENNSILNCTTTLLILSENRTKKKKLVQKERVSTTSLDNITFSALTHFVEQTALELEENLELLNQYKSAVDTTSLISKTDTNGIITYVNDNFCRVSKYTKEELIGANHNIVKDSDISPKMFKKLWKTITKGKVWKGTFPNRAKDGSIYYVEATILPIHNEKGDIKEYIAIRQDITKQVISQQRMQEKERLIKAIFDNQDSIVIYASKIKGMISVNQKLFDYVEYKNMEDFKQAHSCICDLFLEAEGYTNPKQNPNWIDDIAEGKTELTKAKIVAKDGSTRIFNIIIKQINQEFIINLYDITVLEEALQKAYLSEQAKSTFLANMSHEIRTPLNGILGFTDVLKQKKLEKDASRYVDIIHKSGQTLLNVVNDILDFSKLESGELTLYTNESNLFEEMEASVATFASLSKSKEIDYYTYIDTKIPQTLECDVQRIKQVMNNLSSNAIKFTPRGGEVSIKVQLQKIENSQATLYFSVKDSGIGIAKEKLKTVFQAFSQADNSISREFGGTGLGLSISSQYIKMMDSTLEVKSVEGEGSEFYFTLTLPIINSAQVLKDNLYNKSVNIQLLTLKDDITCGINAIVSEYLQAWECNYKETSSLNEVNETTDILIVCAKLFDKKACYQALDKYDKLQLIYIEGATETFSCNHKKFHLLEQPMTGSALFDTIISLSNSLEDITSHKQLKDSTQQHFEGNILVAEDNETNQILISVMLESKGLQYTIVENGQLAVDEALKNSTYDIIFMDINMPVLDGVSATKILRKENYTKPIVSLSANVIESDRKSFLEAGVDATLNKPIVPSELDNILATYLNKSSATPSKVEVEEFDIIDIDRLSKQLSLKNKNIVKTLLLSFKSSASGFVETISSKSTDEDLLHNIKGISGNLRFSNLYNLCIKMEENRDKWSQEEHISEDERLLSHLKNLLKQIEEL